MNRILVNKRVTTDIDACKNDIITKNDYQGSKIFKNYQKRSVKSEFTGLNARARERFLRILSEDKYY